MAASDIKRNEIVILESKGKPEEFTPAHAEGILKHSSNTGPGKWALPADSKYTTDENGNLIRTTGNSTDRSPKE